MKHISPQELEQQLKEGRALSIIDVREYEEVAHGKIPGARHIPLGQLLERMNEFDKNEEHILVCRSGNRSGMACQLLESYGYQVVNMTGGMLEWTGEIER
ncbi:MULTISPECIES: rhodanese-like domain-containing protein [Anoxybacillus]|uniref:Putative adenylyltransferase/sulfurtransferase MoeZ n=1 Tax=Anoxybacillus ayderensis TaxID=265546 RepID=A0A0D0H1N0_9BACL|nr:MULTISPECIES: rhodanese-like domain-containing protein [Anoxybacillus]EPZ37828.1 Rhodanese-related sulfurtransferase [Anoxybacillus ayderensis]KHF27127.1 putative adenylyltransferase/sulfurtransferase MoeZ [Anoxybacillus sp. BCO1]KIP21901.1 putative adenylyltransferase/sulfurtransferase MoeZ [Anoxybacillus ayderensis]NNU97549.1 rhodanese-like domain-containing protein [Anoxybacillus sp. EFIL]